MRTNLRGMNRQLIKEEQGGRFTLNDFGTILSVAGPIIGGMMQSDSADSAANAQQQSTAAGIGEQRRQYDLNRQDLAPWRSAGGAAITKLSDLLGLSTPDATRTQMLPNGQTLKDATIAAINEAVSQSNAAGNPYNAPFEAQGSADQETLLSQFQQRVMDKYGLTAGAAGPDTGALTKKFTIGDFNNDPVAQLGLQFGLNEGEKGINNMARARGSLNSGATLKALDRYGNDYGTTKAADSYNRFVSDQTNLYNRLAGVAGTGQNAANTTATLGSNTANNVSNMLTAQGNARGAASIAGGNAMGGAFNTIGNYYGQQNMLNTLMSNNNYSNNAYNTGMNDIYSNLYGPNA